VLGEEDTNISSANEKPLSFINFCPEVTNNVFGLFASSLSKFTDELDREASENWLVRHGKAFAKDWRWNWSSVTPTHYTECPTYSLLSVALKPVAIVPKRDEVLLLRPGLFGMSIDLRKLLTRLARWWLTKNG
jgi:hypothetical protein